MWTAATDQRGVFRLVLKPPIFRDGSANWIGETDVGISIIIDTYNDFGKDDEYGQGGSGSTEEAERIKVFYGSATPPLDVTFGGGFIPYVSFDLLGVDPVQSISLKDITIGGGEFGLVSSLDETASGFSTSVPSYNVYVNADTSTVQLLTFIDDSLSCTAEQIASGDTDNCFTTQSVTIDGSEASTCSLLTCSYFSEISLNVGSKTVRVTVYSATSETFYLVTFIRPDVPTFSSVTLSKGQNQLNFSPKTFTYYLEYSYDNNGEGLTFKPIVNGDTTGSAITFVSSGGYESTASFLSGSSQGIELSTTDTIVVMTVTSLDETVKSTYTFYVDVKESPFLSSLDVIGEQMVPAFTASSYTYAVNVLATVSSITLSSIVSSDVPHVSPRLRRLMELSQ